MSAPRTTFPMAEGVGIFVGVVAWRLARRKSRHPVLVTVLCVLLCLVPPFALLALLILALWRDMPVRA